MLTAIFHYQWWQYNEEIPQVNVLGISELRRENIDQQLQQSHTQRSLQHIISN